MRVVIFVLFVLFSAFILTKLGIWSGVLDPIKLFVAMCLIVSFFCIGLTILDHFFPSLLG